MKRKLTFIAFAVICLSLLSYGTLAFFTTVGTAHNVVATGGVGIDLLEWADSGKTVSFPGGGMAVMPGVRVIKIAEVKNIGEAAAYIRMRVRTTVTLRDGAPGDPAPVSLDIDTENWTERDGFYYYNRNLAPGETTPPLFTTVTFDADKMGDMYQDGTAKVGLVACAVQSVNNGESVFEAAGWPEIKEGIG